MRGSSSSVVQAVPVHRLGAGRRDQCSELIEAVAGAQMQLGVVHMQRGTQGLQRVMQPPAAGRARRPVAVFLRRVDVHRQHALVRGTSGMQGGVVGEAQVAAQPDDGKRHGR